MQYAYKTKILIFPLFPYLFLLFFLCIKKMKRFRKMNSYASHEAKNIIRTGLIFGELADTLFFCSIYLAYFNTQITNPPFPILFSPFYDFAISDVNKYLLTINQLFCLLLYDITIRAHLNCKNYYSEYVTKNLECYK